MLTELISQEGSLQVVGTANNGKVALSKLYLLKPDIITLDLEMPEMDGFETIEHIRKFSLTLPIIILSVYSEQGAYKTFKALSLGATDYVTKPKDSNNAKMFRSELKNKLIPKIIGLYKVQNILRIVNESGIQNKSNIFSSRFGMAKIDVVVIGVSTGGVNALIEVIPRIPSNFPIPILIVLHIPPLFSQKFSERLNELSSIQVLEGENGMEIKPGTAYIAPGDYHIYIQKLQNKVILKTNQEPLENSCRPSVDVLFRSVAQTYGENSLAIIMTGMGEDGLKGCEEIKKAGGQVIVQNKESSIVWGMPGAVFNAGLSDKEVPLNMMAQEICTKVQKGRKI